MSYTAHSSIRHANLESSQAIGAAATSCHAHQLKREATRCRRYDNEQVIAMKTEIQLLRLMTRSRHTSSQHITLKPPTLRVHLFRSNTQLYLKQANPLFVPKTDSKFLQSSLQRFGCKDPRINVEVLNAVNHAHCRISEACMLNDASEKSSGMPNVQISSQKSLTIEHCAPPVHGSQH